MIGAAAYIRRETRISIAINVVLSLVFFLIVFQLTGPLQVWGTGHFAFDFAPQSFMIAFMSTLVPGMMTARKLANGVVLPMDQVQRLRMPLVVRAMVLAGAAALAGAGLAVLLFHLFGMDKIDWTTALVVKLLYGGCLARIVTPIGLQDALARS